MYMSMGLHVTIIYCILISCTVYDRMIAILELVNDHVTLWVVADKAGVRFR